jgi:5-(carboxyamino)imidazole ribonucleotide mutase
MNPAVTNQAQVAIIMGSDSDWKVMKKAQDVLEEFGVKCEATVLSAHRTPEDLAPFAAQAKASGIKIIIAGAGGAAHLPGMVASFSLLPVIGVPIQATSLQGLDALLSIAQMPFGIPVACMSVENAGNAALLALRILALHDETLSKKLFDYRQSTAEASRQKTQKLKESK